MFPWFQKNLTFYYCFCYKQIPSLTCCFYLVQKLTLMVYLKTHFSKTIFCVSNNLITRYKIPISTWPRTYNTLVSSCHAHVNRQITILIEKVHCHVFRIWFIFYLFKPIDYFPKTRIKTSHHAVIASLFFIRYLIKLLSVADIKCKGKIAY